MPETPVFASAAVAAPHSLAAETGQIVLAQGGNAVEAAIAMAATMAVVAPHACGLGSDGFWLVRESGGRVYALDATGPAGGLATIKRYRDKGYDRVPQRGPDAAVTVAGAVAGWRLALELARALGGKLPLDTLLSDAIRLAREGHPVSRAEAERVLADEAELFQTPGFAAAYLIDGKRPSAGAVRRLPGLAETLAQLAHAGLGDFYRGDVGREIAADLERIGSPIRRRDMETYAAKVVRPLAIRLKAATVHGAPLPTRGVVSLLALGIFDRMSATRGESPERHHALLESVKRAYALTDSVVTDPAETVRDPAELLSPALCEREAAAIDERRAAPIPRGEPAESGGGWIGVIDGAGLAVSYGQSMGGAFGSGCVLPATGVLWNNRGAAFSLDPAARNPLQPGRRPVQDLGPALAAFDDGRVLAFGSSEGHGPEVQALILSRYLAGMSLADAVEAPRWIVDRGREAGSLGLKVEEGTDSSLIRALSRLGHEPTELGPRADRAGDAGMVAKHRRNGRVEAVHDPRTEGAALGL